jgi:cytidylate kinase
MNRRNGIVVAIDGNSGSGKSTVARLAARKLGFEYLDTGAMYRAVTLVAIRRKVDLNDQAGVAETARSCRFRFEDTGGLVRTFANGEDITDEIRSPEVERWVSLVSSYKGVRESLVAVQRKMCRKGGVVCEGRDIGTVVCPDAEVKFFLTASPEVRALRRKKQFGRIADRLSVNHIEEEIERRDREDSSREISPLKKADDAVVIDTTELTIEEEVKQVIEAVRRATARAS